MTAYTDFHYSPTGSGVISGSQVLEQTEQGINGLGQYVQDNISGAIDTANQALTIAQTANTNATTALNTANSFSDAITTANQTANNALTTAQSAQSTANAASSLATTANNNATSALNAANAATSNVNTLTSTVNGLGNRMTAAENAISANAGNITTLQTNLQTTNNNVTAAANAASAAQATATSAQSTATLARNQAYVLRYTGTTITGGGTIAYADIDNTDNIKAGDKIIDISGAIYDIASVDTANQTVTVGASPVINLFCDAENLIPAANDAYDLGSSSYQWNNAYIKSLTINGVACGDILTHNASEFVNVTGNQTISGEKTFSKSVAVSVGSSADSGYSVIANISRKDVGDGKYYGTYIYAGAASGPGVLGVYGYIRNTDGTSELQMRLITSKSDGNYILKSLQFQADRYGNTWQFIPSTNNTIDLGTSTNKWKTLNGINPGALSLPDYTHYEPINFSQWDTSGALTNTYTPTEDGWLYVNIKDTATNSIYIYAKSIPDAQSYSVSVYGNGSQGLAGRLATIIPVIKGLTYGVVIKAASVNDIYAAKFFPALGNV